MITPLDENIFSHQLDMVVDIYAVIPSKNKVDYKLSKIAIVPERIYNILSSGSFYCYLDIPFDITCDRTYYKLCIYPMTIFSSLSLITKLKLIL